MTTTSTNQRWQRAVDDAMNAPHRAVTARGPVSAAILHRASLGRRVAEAHERAVREAKELADDVARLVAALERDGIGASLTGNNFAGQARTLSGAMIRLGEAREIFQTMESYRRAERDAASPGAAAAEDGVEPEGDGDDIED